MRAHSKNTRKGLESLPVWYQPEAVLGSAVRYVAGLSGKCQWVGIYVLKGKKLVLGPYLGDKTEHTEISVGQGICGTAVSEDRDINVPDVTKVSNYLSCSIETRSELVVLIRNAKGQILGQIDIDSHFPDAFDSELQSKVKQVAQKLGQYWPKEKRKRSST
jgi:L-methionine (R)-S-oxide reductase